MFVSCYCVPFGSNEKFTVMRLLFVLLLYVFIVLPGRAQSLSYTHYGVKEGLPGNVVYCAAQDHRGFMWFGTDKGLVRFDGRQFQVFGVKDGLPDPEVLNLFEDSYHRLWISCFSQQICYIKNGQFFTNKNNSLLEKVNFKTAASEFSEDKDGNVWVAGRDKFAYIFKSDTIQRAEFSYPVARVEQIGNLVTGISMKYLMQNFKVIYAYKPDDEKTLFVSSATIGDQTLIALTTKLLLIDYKNGFFSKKDSFVQLGGRVFADHKGHFWVPAPKGVTCFDNNRQDLSNPVTYLPTKKINAVFEDQHGNMWFCTSGDGIYSLSMGKAVSFNLLNGLNDNNIHTLSHDNKGYILSGDNSGNIYEVINSKIQKIALETTISSNRIRQIISTTDNSRWIATDLGLFQNKGNLTYKIKNNRLSGLKSILLKNDTLWFANHADLSFLKKGEDHFLQYAKRRTTVLCKDAEDIIWAGGMADLCNQRDHFQFNWGDKFPDLKKHIIAIHSAGPGKIWVVTPESGLLLLDVKAGAVTRVQHINQYLEHPIENIAALYCETNANANIWLATNSGVYGINAINWNVVHYDHEDGLADDDVNTVLVIHDTLWAGTVAGLSYLPLTYSGDRTNFSSYITEIRYQLNNQTIVCNLLDTLPNIHRIVLPSGAAMATLNFAGLDYRNPGSIRYQCITTKLLPSFGWWTRQNLYTFISNGFRNPSDTIYTESNKLNFGISPPSGSYQIKITAIMRDFYSNKPDQWTVVMHPRWYNTVWVDLFIWLSVAAAFLVILYSRTYYRKLNIAVSDLQLQALQSQINPHFVGNSINAIQQFFFPPNPLAASIYIDLFTSLLRRTIFLSEKHFNTFEEELSYDTDYLEMMKLRFGDRFHYEVTGADTIPPEMPFPSMLLQPILENATIHGLAPDGASKLSLQFSLINDKFQCLVIDNGIGYNAAIVNRKEHKSKGLDLLLKKVKAFNQLYSMRLSLEVKDRTDFSADRGTCAFITYYPKKIKRQPRILRY